MIKVSKIFVDSLKPPQTVRKEGMGKDSIFKPRTETGLRGDNHLVLKIH